MSTGNEAAMVEVGAKGALSIRAFGAGGGAAHS